MPRTAKYYLNTKEISELRSTERKKLTSHDQNLAKTQEKEAAISIYTYQQLITKKLQRHTCPTIIQAAELDCLKVKLFTCIDQG